MSDKLPEKPDFSNFDNKDLTISLQQRQIEELTKKLAVTENELQNKSDKVLELQNIKAKVEEAKKKSQLELLQGKYYDKKLKLTWDLIVDICSHIMDGFSIEESCTNLGITKVTYHRWIKKAKESKSESDIHHAFLTAVQRARNFEEKRYKNKVDEALFSYDPKDYFTKEEIKALKVEERIRVLALINSVNTQKGKIAVDLLRVRKPKKYLTSSLSLEEETIINTSEIIDTPKTESVEQARMVGKIQEIIRRRAVNISIFEDEDEDEGEIVFE